ncbi:3-hydroxyisobutyrate dehydrogenase [Rhodoligotrophos appendicifer]|uniref:NAD(P)-dependent oxidoreductase n=1 Tax=Rhodoligotrophos appendicifer TaxID=987056 RepID=UPI00118728DD|nr:NAD(P)-dependent oxidoreductase [Rhodoligotrophos appendicifer]
MKVGYIGLGHMGGALAARLQLSQPLFVFDLRAANIEALTRLGATACQSNREVGEKSDIVLLSLQTSEQVREVIFGKDGLREGLARGTMIIDQTTGDANATRQMAKELETDGIELIDGPVSGGPPGAAAGTIAIMVGGTEVQFARAEPVLRMISSNVVHTGVLGTGQVIKLANNLLNAAQRLLTFEVMCLAVKNGATPQKTWEVMVKSSGRNFMLEHTFPKHILTGELAQGFTLGLMHKDVRLAQDLAAASDVPMFFGSTVLALYRDLANEFGRDGEVNLGVKLFERLSGATITPPGAHG